MSEAKQFDISKKAVIAAFQAVKENAGSYGADEQTIKEFEEHLNNNLYKLWNRMASGSYFPKPVRAVAIPKKNGGIRILGIPTVEDRIAQMVAKMYFEPLVEPMFYNDSYGYRPLWTEPADSYDTPEYSASVSSALLLSPSLPAPCGYQSPQDSLPSDRTASHGY